MPDLLMRRLSFVFVIAFLTLIANPCAKAAPRLEPQGYVNDFARVLSAQAKAKLEAALKELEEKTSAEVAVVTVPNVEGGDVDQAAEELFRQWGIGKRGKDNGVLILCAVGDRRVRIEVGYALESVLNDAACGRIIREQMIPRFRQKDYSGGLLNGTSAVVSLILSSYGQTLDAPLVQPVSSYPLRREADWQFIIWFIFFVFFFIILPIINGYRGSGGFWDDGIWSGGGFGGGGGGFGGFGGGSSGGGGASGGW